MVRGTRVKVWEEGRRGKNSEVGRGGEEERNIWMWSGGVRDDEGMDWGHE